MMLLSLNTSKLKKAVFFPVHEILFFHQYDETQKSHVCMYLCVTMG